MHFRYTGIKLRLTYYLLTNELKIEKWFFCCIIRYVLLNRQPAKISWPYMKDCIKNVLTLWIYWSISCRSVLSTAGTGWNKAGPYEFRLWDSINGSSNSFKLEKIRKQNIGFFMFMPNHTLPRDADATQLSGWVACAGLRCVHNSQLVGDSLDESEQNLFRLV